MSRKLTKQMPTQERLFELFNVDFDTGTMYWKVGIKRIRVGDRAGCVDNAGYIRINVDGVPYFMHRLMYVAYYGDGSLTTNDAIDHKDSNRSNNSISNLQKVTHRVNLGMRKQHRLGRIPYCVQLKHGSWNVQLENPIVGMEWHGTYKTIEEAYLKARSKYLEFHGEYPPMDDEVLKQLNLESIVGK